MKFIKKCGKYLIIYICMVIIFFSALYITALIPKELVLKKISESAEILNNEGGSYAYYINGRDIQIDNYTDAIMLNNIYSIDTNNIIESIIKCRRNYNFGVTTEILGEKEGNLLNQDGTYNPVQDLLDTINKENITSHEYARYWHGYMAIIRPMLIFFNITQIRIIFEIILFISLFLLLFYLYKNVNRVLALLMFLTFLAIDIISFTRNIQGVMVFLIAIITAIFIANKKINEKNVNFILFIIGGLTAYLDFLTTPLITILFPAIIYFVINKEEKIKIAFKEFVLMCLFWGIGYIGIWAVKWLINDYMYNSGLILLSLKQIVFRVNSRELVGTDNIPIKALKYNIVYSVNWISVSILIVSISYAIKNFKYCLKKHKLIYIIISVIPILWYLVIANHSCQHYFFTYKLLVITLFGIVCICVDNGREVLKSKENKTIILIIVFFISVLLFNVFNNLKNNYKYENFELLNDIIKKSDEKLENEKERYENLIGKVYENQKYDEPYILDGFSYVEGNWQNGYVIQDKNGNEYVWVPCTNKDIDYITKIERTNKIEQPLVNYENCYNESYEESIKSALQNGGFYISRYEIGKEGETPVSKHNSKIWTGITREEAKKVIESMYTNINCELINGYAYDTTLNWIEASNNKEIPSTIIDNNYDKDITSGRMAYNNIYDIYDNVLEYSTENLYDTVVIRGFIKRNVTNVAIDESRYCICQGDSSLGNVNLIAIRTILYK